MAEEFARDLSRGDVDAAFANSKAGMDRAALATASGTVKGWGMLRSLSMTTVNIRSDASVTRYTIGGVATFDKASKPYTMTLLKERGTFKVAMFDFE